MSDPAVHFCPECGAPLPEGQTCWDLLGQIIAWEYEDEALLREHFLTVACYNLQHPAQFNPQVLADLKVGVQDWLDGTVTVMELRRRASQSYEGSRRVLRPEHERVYVQRSWTMTVQDVCAPGPSGAAERVRQWGRVVVQEG